MGKRIGAVAVTVLVGAAITFGLAFLSDAVFGRKGVVRMGAPVSQASGYIVPVTIENYSEVPIDDLSLAVPRSVPLQNIRTSSAILLQEGVGAPASDSRIVLLSSVPPRTKTHLLIELDSAAMNRCCDVPNAAAKGLHLERQSSVVSPVRRAAMSALQLAAVYAIVLTVFSLWHQRSIDKLRARIRYTSKKLDAATKDFEASRKKSDEAMFEARRTQARLRHIMLRTIDHYSRELSFWRATMRHMIVARGGTPKNAEEIEERVTEALGTFATLGLPPKAVERVGAWDDMVEGIEQTVRSELATLYSPEDARGRADT